MGTDGENESSKKEIDLPMGVYPQKSGKFRAIIDFFLNLTDHFSVGLGTYSAVDTASRAYKSVLAHRKKITNRKAMIAHVKNYICLE
jgi:hypothetical protein